MSPLSTLNAKIRWLFSNREGGKDLLQTGENDGWRCFSTGSVDRTVISDAPHVISHLLFFKVLDEQQVNVNISRSKEVNSITKLP